MKNTEIIRSLEFLQEDSELMALIVFGSVATNSMRFDSDIDVAYYPRKKFSAQQRQHLADRIAVAVGRSVDLVDLAEMDGLLLRQILTTGKVVFSKTPGLMGMLTSRLLAWQEDFEPQIKAMLQRRLDRFISAPHGN